jgi:hypothetical protein
MAFNHALTDVVFCHVLIIFNPQLPSPVFMTFVFRLLEERGFVTGENSD